ncbi:cathepsin B-like [Ostrinia nubilalis]|uniref:cathepsin B-like n=1 Tax=Ostrinia nubilalis TaxID=29057 RepID=UPI003082354B
MFGLVFLAFIALAASEFDHEIHEKFKTLPKHEFISYFNSLNHSWAVEDYGEDEHFYGAQLDSNHGLPTITHDAIELPEYFDAREEWSHCKTIKEVNNQAQCGSCFLFGAINSASDRTCIHAGVHVHLAEQEGDCIRPRESCKGGDPAKVVSFWVKNGLVSQECKPYDILALYNDGCKEECRNSSIEYSQDKHYAENAYKVHPTVEAISAELIKNGPLVVGFTAFADFRKYRHGVYVHKFGDFIGYHAVRLIGFGIDENGDDYWLAANSWGKHWGEEGYVRIKRGQEALKLEDHVYGGLPKIS